MRLFLSGIVLVICLFSTQVEGKETGASDSIAYGKRYPSYKNTPGKTFSQPFIDVAKACTPSVVFIRAEGGMESGSNQMFNDDFFNHFFGGPPRRPQQPQVSQGSGFIISKEGHIMTNLHVVRGAKKLTVTLQDGTNRQVSATYIGGDSHTDIAVIKLDDAYGNNYPFLELGDSDDLEVGEWVLLDNTIYIADNTRDVYIGTLGSTGDVVFNRAISVETTEGRESFRVVVLGRHAGCLIYKKGYFTYN